MAKNSSSRRKAAAAAAAVAVAASLALGSTFAWTSFSQRAVNEVTDIVNPGARLHDDFNGSNKDVYVENFTDEETGVAVFARVKLSEYMEIGQGAGTADFLVDNGIVVGSTADSPITRNDKDSWPVYVPGNASDFRTYWDWDIAGGQTVYMPTFNMNKDSLVADVNGTWAQNYSDYVEYEAGDTLEGDEVHDADVDTDDELVGDVAKDLTMAVDDGDVALVEDQEHVAKSTINGTVITMEQWLAAVDSGGYDKALGDYWVWDSDGWAYWANPIEPGTATGLLLDGIKQLGLMSESWYYAINVTGQFATADDIGSRDDATGFYGVDAGSAPTENAEKLLDKLIEVSSEDAYEISVTPETLALEAGAVDSSFSAATTRLGESYAGDVTWSVEGASSANTAIVEGSVSDRSATLTVGEDETASVIRVVATLDTPLGPVSDTALVTITGPEGVDSIKDVEVGSTETVRIDGYDWYVLANDGDQYLLWTTKGLGWSMNFDDDDTPLWYDKSAADSSSVRTKLQGEFLPQLTEMSSYLVEKTISTNASVNAESAYTTTDKVFILSAADFGAEGFTDYTFNSAKLMDPTDERASSDFWLRSTQGDMNAMSLYDNNTGTYSVHHEKYSNMLTDVRPAVWVDLSVVSSGGDGDDWKDEGNEDIIA